MRLHPARAVGLLRAPWIPGWSKDPLWRRARAVPSLDLRFADNKSLVDATTGQNLVTFTRASGGTYVDSQGVIRNATTNLLLRSEEFGTTWIPFNASISADILAAPNGTLTADLFVPNSGVAINGNGNLHHLRQQLTVVNGTTYTLSAYVKAGGYNVIRFGLSSQNNLANNYSDITVNLSTLSVTQTLGTGSVVSVGDGWFRVTATGTATSTTGYAVFVIADGGTANGTSGIYLWGAQLEKSSTVGEYIPTTSTINSAPRFDHDPETGESLGLLIEEQRTNFALSSATFQPTSGGSPAAYVVDQVAPDGTTSGSRQTAAAPRTFADYLLGTNAQYTFSVYVKGVGAGIGQLIRLQLKNAASDTIITTGAFFALTSTWTRISVTGTTNGATTGARVEVLGPTLGAPPGTVFWGEQLEVGAFPTSYIPTTSAQVTRNADVASITGANFSSWYRQDEGTVFSSFSIPTSVTTGGARVYNISNSSFTTQVWLRLQGGTNRLYEVTDSSTQQAALSAGTFSAGVVYRGAVAVKTNDFGFSENGATPTTDNSGTLGNADRMGIGMDSNGIAPLNGHISRLTYFNRRLPNATLQAITKP